MNNRRNLRFGLVLMLGALLLGLAAVSLLGQGSPAQAALPPKAPADGTEPLPAGATIETLLSNMNNPVAMAFDPAGRLFYTEKVTGNVRLFENGVLQTNPVISFTVNSSGERGLLGIAIDPNFNSNHYIYVYYTCDTSGGCPTLRNQVVRFQENNGVGSNPQVIFTSPQSATNHNGGNIHFGPDGKLYISVGDNANAANSQDVTVPNGKMHRINSDGTIPADNPVFTQTNALPSLFAMGLRNSFDFDFDPLTGKLFASENGPSCDDELNRVEGGYNYGWRASYPCDDPNPSPTYNTIPPLWFLGVTQCCEAPTGTAFYKGNQITVWHNELFMAAYNTSKLRHFYLDATRQTVIATNVVQGVSVGMDLETGPDGALWYIQGGGYTPGTLKRIVMSTTSTPTATPTAPIGTVTRTPSVTPSPTDTQVAATVTPTATGTQPTSTETPTPTQTSLVTATATDTATAVVSVTATPCVINFTDVHPTDYFYVPVQYLYCQGAISGYADGTFRPYNDTTRAQLSKIIVLAEGWSIDTTGGPHFTDVPTTHPFYAYIETAYNHGIISGYADNTFRPYNNITRGQLTKVIVLAQNWAITPPSQPTFQDVPTTDPFYGYIETAYAHGVISGYSCGTNCLEFRPGNNATRGQISKIVYNAVTGSRGSGVGGR